MGILIAIFVLLPASLWADHIGGAEQALQFLREGNRRYAAHQEKHPDQTPARMKEVARGQHPFAVVLGCSDSRVPPELIFDQGLGDLFVVRVAGNVPDDEVIGSIEYAVEHLQSHLVVVLGHEKCGAVEAAASGTVEHNHTASFVNVLKNVVAKAQSQPGDLIHNAVLQNVRDIVRQLANNEPVLRKSVQKGHVKIVGAVYDLDTGLVRFLDDPLPH